MPKEAIRMISGKNRPITRISRLKIDTSGSSSASLIANVIIIIIILGIMAFGLKSDDDKGDNMDDGQDGVPQGWPPENVDATSSIGPDNEVTVAVNPTDPNNLIAGSKDYALGPDGDGGYIVWAGYFYSKDGGETWDDGLVGRYPGSVLENYEQSSDPVIAFGPDGTAYYCGLAYGVGSLPGIARNALWISESTDGGQSWDDPYIVMAWETTGVFHDKQWLICDQDTGNLYLTWTPFFPDGSRIFFGRSTDGGDTWDYYAISDWVAVGDEVQGSALAMGSDGVLNVIFIDYADRKVVLAQNTMNGSPAGWTNPREIADVDWVSGMPNTGSQRCRPLLPILRQEMMMPHSMRSGMTTVRGTRTSSSLDQRTEDPPGRIQQLLMTTSRTITNSSPGWL